MAKWEQWLENGSKSKEKFKAKHHDDFSDFKREEHRKKRKKSRHRDILDYDDSDMFE